MKKSHFYFKLAESTDANGLKIQGSGLWDVFPKIVGGRGSKMLHFYYQVF